MPLERGRTLGHYVIDNLLGAGGMGEVYAAEDTRLKRRVALKVLPDSVTYDELRRVRFEREAQSVAALNHPNIVTLHSVEHAEGTLFLTMELVDGQPLTELVAKRPIELGRFFAIAIPVADAIATAHQRGITHRDLKPANIMVSVEGRPKVLDFGLAKAFGAEGILAAADTAFTQPATADGLIVGTTAYMSPEQAKGKAVDGRSDLFSLGVVLYEMLTGERPFTGDSNVSVLSSILKDTPRAITELNPSVPRELSQIVRRCLIKDPEKRLQSAKDLRNELEEVKQSLESGELRAPSSADRSGISSGLGQRASVGWLRVNVLWSVGVPLVLLIAAVVGWRLWPTAIAPDDERAPEASFTVLTTQAGLEQHPSLSPDGRWMIYASDAAGSLDIYLQGVGAQTPINLTKESPADDDQPAFSPDGERIAFRSGRDGGGLFVMGRTGELVKRVINRGFNPAWSPDGQMLAFSTQSVTAGPGARGGPGAEIWTVTVSTGETRRLAVNDGVQPAWSPDGARIAYWGFAPQSRNREIWTVSVNGGDPHRITDNPAIDWNPVWAPNGRHLYFGSDRGGSLGLWRIAIDPASGEPVGTPQPIQLPATLAAHFAFSADGSRMVFASYQLSTQVYAADFNARSASIASPKSITRGTRTWDYLDVSADGRRLVLATAYPQEDVFVADASGDNLLQITDDVASDRGVRWSPDGKRILYYSGKPGEIMQIFTMGADGSDVRLVTTEAPSAGTSWVLPQSAPSGDRLAAFKQGDNGYLLEPAGSGKWHLAALPRVGANKEAFMPTAWAHDGRRIVGMTDGTGQLVVYDIDRQAYDETGLRVGTQGVAWLPDGRRILTSQGGNIVMVDLSTRQVSTVIDAPARQAVRSPRLTADGRRLFYLHANNESDIALMTMK